MEKINLEQISKGCRTQQFETTLAYLKASREVFWSWGCSDLREAALSTTVNCFLSQRQIHLWSFAKDHPVPYGLTSHPAPMYDLSAKNRSALPKNRSAQPRNK